MPLDQIEDAIEAVREGHLIVVVDDDDRENEGDLIMAAAKATPEQVAFMIRHTSGILCTPLPAETAERLRLQPMVASNDAPLTTAFTVSVDCRRGLTTGISARERTATIRALADEESTAEDFVRPGHIFPLIGREGGVLVRSGHTEAAIDLARLAGLPPVGVLAELVNDDGTVKRLPDLRRFARTHGLKIISIADLIAYRQQREHLISRLAEFPIETPAGPARAIVYATPFEAMQHLALVLGEIGDGRDVPARIQRENPLADLFEAPPDAADNSVIRALNRLAAQERGVLIYLREPRVAPPASTIAEEAKDEGHGSARARREQWREVGIGAQILRDLGITSIRLLATHHRHYVGLSGFGIEITSTELF